MPPKTGILGLKGRNRRLYTNPGGQESFLEDPGGARWEGPEGRRIVPLAYLKRKEGRRKGERERKRLKSKVFRVTREVFQKIDKLLFKIRINSIYR
jgi:hypothetical protein